jgi:cyclopropane fatty-acyl-phospholipid synthase-like methyltransferase
MGNETSSKTVDWEQAYQQEKTGWDRGGISLNLTYWLEEQQLQPCRLLIPGCGNGHEVLHLAQQGFDVVAIDIAPTAVNNLTKALQQNQLTAKVILADFFNWQPETPFDAIYEQTSLCALAPKQWQAYEQCLYHWLKPNGTLLAQFMQTGSEDGPPYHCEINDMKDIFPKTRWNWSNEHQATTENTPFSPSGRHEKMYRLERK